MASRKGLSNTLWIVITAVIIIVIALVLLTIFGQGIAPVSTLVEFTQQCRTTATISCQTTGLLPLNWDSEVTIGGTLTTCRERLPDLTCEESPPTG